MGTFQADEKPRTTSKKWLRWLLIVTGTFFLGMGIIGIFVPVLPTTPFLLLAAACYARSSERLYAWLLANKWFGKYIRNYLQKKGIPLKIKIAVITMLWAGIGTTAIFIVEAVYIRAILAVIAVGVTVHLLIIPTLHE
jgi:hypothetical protein